jgi:hypothetical protein
MELTFPRSHPSYQRDCQQTGADRRLVGFQVTRFCETLDVVVHAAYSSLSIDPLENVPCDPSQAWKTMYYNRQKQVVVLKIMFDASWSECRSFSIRYIGAQCQQQPNSCTVTIMGGHPRETRPRFIPRRSRLGTATKATYLPWLVVQTSGCSWGNHSTWREELT